MLSKYLRKFLKIMLRKDLAKRIGIWSKKKPNEANTQAVNYFIEYLIYCEIIGQDGETVILTKNEKNKLSDSITNNNQVKKIIKKEIKDENNCLIRLSDDQINLLAEKIGTQIEKFILKILEEKK